MITLEEVKQARERVGGYVLHTPLVRVRALDELLGCKVYLKLENMQVTGSFKLRGAVNCMQLMSEEECRRGVVTTSSGNHAQGVAYAARAFGIQAKIVMPQDCNPVKLRNVRSYGAEAVLVDIMARDAAAAEIMEREGKVMLHAFADPRVKAGQGTIGIEILEDESDIDAVVTPIGGGGLLSGVATAVKALKPSARVYGVENEVTARYANCKAHGRVLDMESLGQTIADGTRGSHADPDSYETILARTDGMLQVGDDWIRPAMRAVVAKAHTVAEPSSCMTVAAALAGRLPVGPEDKVAFVLSGGNNDLRLLSKILAEPDENV